MANDPSVADEVLLAAVPGKTILEDPSAQPEPSSSGIQVEETTSLAARDSPIVLDKGKSVERAPVRIGPPRRFAGVLVPPPSILRDSGGKRPARESFEEPSALKRRKTYPARGKSRAVIIDSDDEQDEDESEEEEEARMSPVKGGIDLGGRSFDEDTPVDAKLVPMVRGKVRGIFPVVPLIWLSSLV